MGADAAKAVTPDPAFEPLRSDSDAPPRQPDEQPERSRTPPANYSVAAPGRGSSPPVERVSIAGANDSSAGGRRADGGEKGEDRVVATLPGASMPATPAGGYASPAPPRASVRPERRSVPLPTQVRAGRSPVAGDPPRTITQTGLAPAPDPAHRLVQATDTAEAPITEEPEAARNGAAAVGTPRASRLPAAGSRRTPSSDETPAQKPSSISVPSGSLTPASSRIRTKHVVALGGLLLGLGLIVSGSLSSRLAPSAPTVDSALAPGSVTALALPEPPHVENRSALVPDPVPADRARQEPSVTQPASSSALPTPQVPASARLAPPAAASPEAASPAPVAVVPAPQVTPPRPARAAPPVPVRPATSPAREPVLEIRPSDPAPATAQLSAGASPAAPVTGRGELAAPAEPSPAPPPPVAPSAASPAPASPSPAAPSPAAPSPATDSAPPGSAPAAPAAPGTPPATAPAAAPFDLQRAKVQLGIAAFKASTCGSLGGTRGAGDVRVVIESFGRVTRVTHSNPAFVGTPVGTCVTQAYQQVQVAPFSGSAQTLSSSFVVP